MSISKSDKAKRKAILQQVKLRERERAIAALPLSTFELQLLFDYVNKELQNSGCDHTLSGTLRFVKRRALNEHLIISWLESYGGYCDCEVIANVESEWSEILKQI